MTLHFSVRIGLALSAALMFAIAPIASDAADDSAGHRLEYRPDPRPLPRFPSTPELTELGRRAAELVDWNKSEFAGYYFTGDGRLVVAASSTKGEDLAQKEFVAAKLVSVEVVEHSLTELSEMGERLYRSSARLGAKMSSWEADPRSGGLIVTVFQEIDAQDRETAASFAAANQLSITVFVDPEEGRGRRTESQVADNNPFSGGFRYVMANGTTSSASTTGDACSGGFGYLVGSEHNVLTAGHCFPRGTTYKRMWSTTAAPARQPATTRTRTSGQLPTALGMVMSEPLRPAATTACTATCRLRASP